MEKKRGKIIGVFLILMILLGGLIIYEVIPFAYYENIPLQVRNIPSITSNSFSNIPVFFISASEKLPFDINSSVLILIIQGGIVFLILLVAISKFIRHRKKEEKVAISNKIIPKKSISETNLDLLYNLLKEKRSMSTKTIASVFKISKERALDWARILENHDLVQIEYPSFDLPEVKIKGKEHEKEKKKPRVHEKEKGKKKVSSKSAKKRIRKK